MPWQSLIPWGKAGLNRGFRSVQSIFLPKMVSRWVLAAENIRITTHLNKQRRVKHAIDRLMTHKNEKLGDICLSHSFESYHQDTCLTTVMLNSSYTQVLIFPTCVYA